MLRMTPGQCAEGVLGGATALGSFDLTVRGVRETPSVRSELSKRLGPVGQRASSSIPNQRAVTLARWQPCSLDLHTRACRPSVRDVRGK